MRAVLLLLLVPSTAFADRVILKEGQVIEGRVLSSGKDVVIQIDGGKISFAQSEIKAIEKDDQGAIAQLGTRRSALQPNDVKGRLALGRWAKAEGLTAEADVLFTEILEIDPNQAEAHLALGHVKHEGKWLTADEHQRALGMVRYGGRWVSATEAQAADANLRARAESRREPASTEEQASSIARGSSRVDQIAWGNDQWIDGAPPLANWVYPVYGHHRGFGRSSGPSAALNVTITGRGGAISPAPTVLTPTAPKPQHSASVGPNSH